MNLFFIFKKSPCSSGPCLNQGTCVAKYENNDYHCACPPLFVGKHCEIGIYILLLAVHALEASYLICAKTSV